MKILLVDDHVMLCETLSGAASDNDDISEFRYMTSPVGIREEIQNFSPDVVLMDIDLGEYDGLDIAEELLAENSKLNIIFLSSFDKVGYNKRAKSMGGKGFISKEGSLAKMLQTIKDIMSGQTIYSNIHDSNYPDLTGREVEVLQLLSNGSTQDQIAQECNISINTLRSHIKKINRKFDTNSHFNSILKAIELGIIKKKL